MVRERNPVARSLRSPHLAQRVVPDGRRDLRRHPKPEREEWDFDHPTNLDHARRAAD